MRIAVDVMGSDKGPRVIARGAFQALQELDNLELLLIGDPEAIQQAAEDEGVQKDAFEFVDASVTINMDEHPIEAIRKKPESSLVQSVKLLEAGKADALISAGSTGAFVAASSLLLRTLDGVRRTGIATLLPSLEGQIVVIDVGANVEPRAVDLYQYGVMGSLYAREVLGLDTPRVALLSVGSESTKGNSLVKETNARFTESNLNFAGNCEGHEIFHGKVDVVVCGGFVGNVLLKITEGLSEALVGIFSQSFSALNMEEDPAFRQAIGRVQKRIDWTEVGGAQLLGIRGTCVAAHGRSNETAILSSVRTAYRLVQANLNQQISRALESEPLHAP